MEQEVEIPKTPRCGSCQLYTKCISPKMQPTGRFQKKILILAEAPGKDEDKQGRQLVGNSGQELERTLSSFGIDMREDCLLTNTLICRPPGNSKPTPEQVYACLPNLLKTIEEYNPVVIIALGGASIYALTRWLHPDLTQGITAFQGYQIPCQKLNAWICPTFHPSYVLREDREVITSLFRRDLKNAVRIDSRPFKKVPDYESQTRVVSSSAAVKIIKWMEEQGGNIAYDYECDRTRPERKDSKIVTCAISWEGRRTIGYPWTPETAEATKNILLNPHIGKIGANIKFEQRWTYGKLGIRIPARDWVWDTQLTGHQIDNRDAVTSLSFQSFVYLGQGPYDRHIKKFFRSKGGPNSENNWREISLDHLMKYNAMDALLEFKLFEAQLDYLECV